MKQLTQKMRSDLLAASSFELTYIWQHWLRYGLMFSLHHKYELAVNHLALAADLAKALLDREVQSVWVCKYFMAQIFHYRMKKRAGEPEAADEVLISSFQFICGLRLNAHQQFIYKTAQQLLNPHKHDLFIFAYTREFGAVTNYVSDDESKFDADACLHALMQGEPCDPWQTSSRQCIHTIYSD